METGLADVDRFTICFQDCMLPGFRPLICRNLNTNNRYSQSHWIACRQQEYSTETVLQSAAYSAIHRYAGSLVTGC